MMTANMGREKSTIGSNKVYTRIMSYILLSPESLKFYGKLPNNQYFSELALKKMNDEL